jgi:hypothetical protein
MKLELEFYSYACFSPTFTINGIDADSEDFGDAYDRNPEKAADYSCADMQFTRIPAKLAVLERYNISIPEYELIAGQLEVGLSLGRCGSCV